MTSYADNFTLLAPAPSIMEAGARANQLCSSLVRWADGKQLAIESQKSSATLFTSDTHHSWLHPQVRICNAVAQLNITPKILDVMLDTHFTFGPHIRNCVKRASKALNVMKALAWSSWGFTTETLVAPYKAIVCPILNYAAPIWFTQVSSTHLNKHEVIQNEALRIATGCHQKAAASHLRAETGVLPLRVHLELCSQEFYATALQPLHPSHSIVTSPPDYTPSGPSQTPTLLPPYLEGSANKRWRPQRPSPHL